jgi:GAF domain-containing protein
LTGTTRKTAPHSTFRTVALIVSAISTVLFLLCAAAVVRYGGHYQEFGFSYNMADGRLAVERVFPNGPADGRLQVGDELLAWNGDPSITRVGAMPFGRNLRRDAEYTLTIRRAGVDREVTLNAPRRAYDDPWRFSTSNLGIAFVWFLVATMIALFRPELTVSRNAYAAGILFGCSHAQIAASSALPWLPDWWRTVVLLTFPWYPLHVAVGYDFYSRFPPGVATTRAWRGIRIALYTVCGVMFVFGALVDTAIDIVAPDRAGSVRAALLPVDRWLQWPGRLMPLAGVATLAVMIRNYRAVEREDDRRRVRWVLWGTVLGLTPLLAVEAYFLAMRITGSPFNIRRWHPVVNLAMVMIPVSMGYAIIRHHVFDITFVVRRGLQYLLARNALRLLLALPIAGLAYGLVVHRDQPIGQLLWTRSAYLYLIAAAILSLRFRTQLSRWVDRRFFRESYDSRRILVELIDNVEKLESASGVSKLVSHEIEAAFHPQCLFIWYREGDKPNLTLSFSSGGPIHAVELSPASPLLQLAESASRIVELPLAADQALSGAERAWLDDAGVRLMVPMIGSDRRLTGLLMLGDRKSDEPYSSDDERLLQAIARQIALARDRLRLQDRVDHDRRLRHDVLAHLATGSLNVLKECPTCGVCYDAAAAVCSTDGSELTLSLPVERTIDGKYRLDRLIGRGGMGAVYEAADLRLSRTVAVKIMLGRAFGDRRALRRFEREAQVCARLTHPNIVTVFDYGGVGADGAFLVMEFIEGRTLRHELNRRGYLPGPVAAAWFEQICEGMAAAHRRDVVHRDLKPENVVIAASATGSDIVKVLDFGLAKVRTAIDETGLLTDPGVVMGTAGYMAPEQLTGVDADLRVDVFAIGVMAAEVITGSRPFRGRTQSELLAAIVNDPVTLGGDGEERRRLESILRLATASNPAQRYASVTALMSDLVPALRALPMALQDADTPTALSADIVTAESSSGGDRAEGRRG